MRGAGVEPLKREHAALATLALVLRRIAEGFGEREVDSINLSARDLYRDFGTDEMFDIYADLRRHRTAWQCSARCLGDDLKPLCIALVNG
jgi:hypothetical protein